MPRSFEGGCNLGGTLAWFCLRAIVSACASQRSAQSGAVSELVVGCGEGIWPFGGGEG